MYLQHAPIITEARILTAANNFVLYHRYDILMLSLLSWSYLGGNVGFDDDDDNDHISQTEQIKKIKFVN